MTAFHQLEERRRANGISRRALAEAMGCSLSWVRLLELGYEGWNVREWRERYEVGLSKTIDERKSNSDGRE